MEKPKIVNLKNILPKHKREINATHVCLHTVYWIIACLTSPTWWYAALAFALGLITIAVAFVGTH